MKKMGDMLLNRTTFSEIVMGNTALVRAMIEAGTQVVTSYPGSPTPEIAAAIQSIPVEERPFYFEFSINEKVATEVAYGAAVNGHLSTVFFKSVGLNVAADTFVQLSLMNIIGGLVIVLGDDPGANSSQNEQDNRHYGLMSYTPIFEPANPEEVYTFYLEAARLAATKQMPVILRMTTHVCHAKAKVHFQGWQPSQEASPPLFNSENGPYIPIASLVFPMKRNAVARLGEVEAEYTTNNKINTFIDHQNVKRGIISMGLPFLSLMDVLQFSKHKPDILKLGMVHPLPIELIYQFLQSHDEVKILEELDDILEKEIKALAFDRSISTKIYGKMDAEDWMGEYTPDKVYQVLQSTWPDLLPKRETSAPNAQSVPARPAQMCPGCGHRSAFHAVKKALADQDISVADIGCHTLGFLPPYNMGELLMCMGASPGMGSGLSLFNSTRKVVVFMGDSTFYHAGLPGIINTLYNNHSITMIVMENGTTAMTGHQDNPTTGRNFNEVTDKIPIRQVLEGLGVQQIYECDTYRQAELTKLVKQAVNDDFFSVVIARHPCMLKLARNMRRRSGFVPKLVDINQDTCEKIHECVQEFGCPSFIRHTDGTVGINPDLCIGDGSCVQTCPVSAITPPQKVETEAQ